ncbi:MAG: hypothetical protein KF771_06805 [Burkholderiales bacterium]|nr:hypothetical protein [Burkholderiales bacterium]
MNMLIQIKGVNTETLEETKTLMRVIVDAVADSAKVTSRQVEVYFQQRQQDEGSDFSHEKIQTESKTKLKSTEPYAAGMIPGSPNIKKNKLIAKFVGISGSKRENRGSLLISPKTRCFKRHEVHELMMTDENSVCPGRPFERSATLGFIEFSDSGLLIEGDTVVIGNEIVGTIAGFDETHFPNHLNIVLKTTQRTSGVEMRLNPGDLVSFMSKTKVAV